VTIHRVPTCRCGHPQSPEHDGANGASGGSCRICGCPGFHKRRHGAVEVTTGTDPKAREQLLEIAKTVERAAVVLTKTAADMIAAFGERPTRRRQQTKALSTAISNDVKPTRTVLRPMRVNDQIPRGHRRILLALARYGECSKAKLAILARYAVNGGGFNNYLSELRGNGEIEGTDPYRITPMGRDVLGPYEPLPHSPAALFEEWMRHPELGRAHRAILEVLRAAHGLRLDKTKLAELCEPPYEPDGGGFNNAVSRLRTLGLIEGKHELHLAAPLRG